LWASFKIPFRSSKIKFFARCLALKLSSPQYTASAPAAIAAFIESISPPGAINSKLFFKAKELTGFFFLYLKEAYSNLVFPVLANRGVRIFILTFYATFKDLALFLVLCAEGKHDPKYPLSN
jgi:hypothetical protein